MKKYLLIISSVGILLGTALTLALSPAAHAVDITQGCTGAAAASAACKDAKSVGTTNPLFGPHGILTIAIQMLTILIGVSAIVVLMIAGIRFITANGDAGSIAKARSTIIYAVIGLAVTAMSQAIITFVLSKIS